MPEIKSSIGSRSFSASAGSRVVDIPDETEGSGMHQHSGPAAHMPQHMHASRHDMEQAELREQHRMSQAERRRGERITPQAKERAEFLANLGRKTKDVVVETSTFSIRTLKGSETRAAIMATASVEMLERPFEARRQQLARAVYAIDGHDVALALGTDLMEAKVNFIEDLDDNVIAYLYSEWVKLNAEAAKAFSVNSDEEMKEVLEDIKK